MDPAQLQFFVQEAESRLRAVRSSLLISRQDGSGPDLKSQIGPIQALRQKAGLLDLSSLETVLAELENVSAHSFPVGEPLSDYDFRILLDLVSHAEAEVVKLHVRTDEQVIDLGEFVDNSFDILQLDALLDTSAIAEPQEAASASEPEVEAEDEFEADEEMLEIFAEEAEELLGNIETNLALLSAAPDNREALWEVRRHAHTFKGAAGIIGLKKPSKLAHRIEDLLDHLSQNGIVPTAGILDLIGNATSCLRVITKGDTSPGALEQTAEIYKAFDSVMIELTTGPAEPASVEAVAATPEPAAQPVAVEKPAEVADNSQQAPRPIVRVSINRLDELVRIVRDLVVSRSMMEQRIAEFENHLETMARTTRRLQAANAQIENDFEASMLGSQVPVSFSQRNPFQDVPSTLDEAAEFDSLELDRYTDFHQSSRELSEATQDCFATITALEALKDTLEAVFDDQRRLIEETQEKVMQIRLIRFGSIATRIQRAVRVTCEEENKQAEILIENQEVEIDTDLLDSLVEPLMHLIRNAVVHGIEPPDTRRLVGKPDAGRIAVRLTNEETHIELRVSDDGRGISGGYLRERAISAGLIDPQTAAALDADELLSLMFMPGLTTAEKLTMSAGRGVGMSIVKESVEARNGSISVETFPQQGTTFTVKIPLAFAVAQSLLVKSDGNSAAIPLKVVKQVIELQPGDIFAHESRSAANIGSDRYEVRYLSDFFPARQRREEPDEVLNTLLIETGEDRFALIIDEIVKTEEIAIKPLGKPLDTLSLVLGVSVLGNGEIVPVLDVSQLYRSEPVDRTATPVAVEPEKRTRVLVVDDSPSVRHMTSKVITSAGWEALTAKDGVEALEALHNGDLPDVILTDVEMPRMDGYELVAAVQKDEILRAVPMVFITSRASDKHRERAAELGINEYLTKPFVESELVGLVERLCQPETVI
ncbi:MAG: response regulator [Acidobacteria bacterium]|nr:response regulator [Acidobacteriota bacterium]